MKLTLLRMPAHQRKPDASDTEEILQLKLKDKDKLKLKDKLKPPLAELLLLLLLRRPLLNSSRENG